MIHRIKDPEDIHKGMYVAPGGAKKEEETMKGCVKREIREELGVELDGLKIEFTVFFDNRERIFPNGKMVEWDYECGVYTATGYSGTIKKTTDKGNPIFYFNNAKAPIQHAGDKIIPSFFEHSEINRLTIRHRGNNLVNVTAE